jgi:hypothetical protein
VDFFVLGARPLKRKLGVPAQVEATLRQASKPVSLWAEVVNFNHADAGGVVLAVNNGRVGAGI